MGVREAALAAFPQLRGLEELCAAGWSFLPLRGSDGELVELRGVRAWPGGYADALRLRYLSDAAAIRCDDTGGLLWRREGTLTEIVDGLLALPAPHVAGAPRLVKATVPRLWTP